MPPERAPLTVVVLAAGQGTRMRSKTIKLLHAVAGRPMVCWVVEAAAPARPSSIVVVVGFQEERVRAALADAGVEFVLQREQRGTGHAVLEAARRITRSPGATLLILNGDLPTLRPATLRAFVAGHRRSKAALSLSTTEVTDPRGYGRIVRDADGRVERIVEQGDASPAERRIREINCGLYCADPRKLLAALGRVQPDNVQGEYYLTDAVHELIRRGETVRAELHPGAEELLGVNTRAELARAGMTLWRRKAAALLESGVTLLDPERTWIDPRARIGRDTVLYPGVIVEGATIVGEDCSLGPGVRIVDCRLGSGVVVRDHSLLVGARIGDRASIGPFAHLRPGSVLGRETKVGNFVEVKKARLGDGTKASHLSYLGDAEIGKGCNIGAGTITCNYDGDEKHLTRLGAGVFVGSDTTLVAPVHVHAGAYVAAGSTVTDDVPSGALAVARGRQRNVAGWVAKRRGARRKPGGKHAPG